MHLLLINTDQQFTQRLLEAASNNVRLTVASVSSACPMLGTGSFDAAVIDLRGVNDSISSILRRLRSCAVALPIVAVHACESPQDRIHALQSGADECLSGIVDSEELLVRVEVVLRRRVSFAPSLRRFQLTPAEARVAELIAAGYTLKDAATQLGVSIQTVRSELKRVFQKTGAHRQVELVRILLSIGDRNV